MPSPNARFNLNSAPRLFVLFLLSAGINLQTAFAEQSFSAPESSNNDQKVDQASIVQARNQSSSPSVLPTPSSASTNGSSSGSNSPGAADPALNSRNTKQEAVSKPSSEESNIEVERWDFGIVIDRSGPTKDWRLHPVVLIPNLAGVQYAWKLKTNCKLPVFVREEFTLPEPPSTWKLKEGETTSELKNGGEQCILESFQPTDDGWIGHAWTASHGDPAGRYQIKIFLNGKLAHQFLFNVGESVKLEGEGRDW